VRQSGVEDAGKSLGSPDGRFARVGTVQGSELVLDLGCWSAISNKSVMAVYEHKVGPPWGILQDQQVVSVGDDLDADGNIEWTIVYVFGDEPGENPNTFIPSQDLYTTYAFLIDLNNLIGQSFRWVRFQNYPQGIARTPDEQVEVDAIRVMDLPR
jgi:hypothetical protein